ncbi:unnamed protein product [Closterium sp. NIES-64]|nr:unnamed protein product [Closterium sp. NIES-64]
MLAVVPNDELHTSRHMQTLPQLANISARAPEPLVQEAKPLLGLPAGATVCALAGLHVFHCIRNKVFTLEPFIMRQTVKEVEPEGAGNERGWNGEVGRRSSEEGNSEVHELKGELKDELKNVSAAIFAVLERELGELKCRLLKVESEKEAAVKVAAEQAAAEKVGSMERELGELKKHLLKVEGEMEAAEQAAVEKVNDFAGAVERELGEVKKHLLKVEGEQAATVKVAAEKADAEKLNELVGAVERDLGEVKGRMIKVEGERADAEKVNDLEQVTREGFAAVKGEVAAVKEKVAAVEGELAVQKVRLLESEAARDEGLAAVKGELTSVKVEVVAMKGEVATMKEKVAAVEGELTNQKVRLLQLEEEKKAAERVAHERVKRDAKRAPNEAAVRKILEQPGPITKEQVEECKPS